MAVSVADQCIAKYGCTVSTGGSSASYAYGDVLPAATADADLAVRATLRQCGMLRAVTACTTAGDFNTAMLAAATCDALLESGSTSTALAKPVAPVSGSLPVVANY